MFSSLYFFQKIIFFRIVRSCSSVILKNNPNLIEQAERVSPLIQIENDLARKTKNRKLTSFSRSTDIFIGHSAEKCMVKYVQK